MEVEKPRRSRSNDNKRVPRKLKKGLKKRVLYDCSLLGEYPKKVIYKGVENRTAEFQVIE